MTVENLVSRIDAVLPQTQCGECGYPACRPYAKALALGEVTIDKCQPGGERVLNKVAAILDLDPAPYLDTVMGNYRPPSVYHVIADQCIGCAKCIRACPVDAIVGAPKHLHVIVPELCSGCGLCVEPCPVDCIAMSPLEALYEEDTFFDRADRWRTQYEARNNRLARDEQQKLERYQTVKQDMLGDKHDQANA
jgi:electron transport complex protein RnfB